MTPEYRKAHLVEIHARDKIYDAGRRDSRKAYDTMRYFADVDENRRKHRNYYWRNREKVLRRVSARLCAEDMIAEALS